MIGLERQPGSSGWRASLLLEQRPWLSVETFVSGSASTDTEPRSITGFRYTDHYKQDFTAEPERVAVDEKQIEVDSEEKWLYAATDTESKLLLEIDVNSRRGTDPAAVFLHRLTEKHDVSDAEFLVNAGGYMTALFRLELSRQLDYEERNHIEKWFQTVSKRIDRFHSFSRGSQSSACRWLQRFRHQYNIDRTKCLIIKRSSRRGSTRQCL